MIMDPAAQRGTTTHLAASGEGSDHACPPKARDHASYGYETAWSLQRPSGRELRRDLEPKFPLTTLETSRDGR